MGASFRRSARFWSQLKVKLATNKSNAAFKVSNHKFSATVVDVDRGLAEALPFAHGSETAIPESAERELLIQCRRIQIKY